MLKGRALLLAGMAALLALPTGLQAGEAIEAQSSFTPPSGPMTLTRTVWRDLSDGKVIKVARTYAITIIPESDGYLVDGSLIATAVDAPPQVAMLAELERRRADTGLFPIRLDRQGQIRPDAETAPAASDQPELARAGSSLVAGSALPAEAQQRAQAMLEQVMGAARARVAWPTDLFNPGSSRTQLRRAVPLPDGGTGEVAVSVVVERGSPGQLPRSVERTVKTTLDGTARFSREVWTLVPVSPP